MHGPDNRTTIRWIIAGVMTAVVVAVFGVTLWFLFAIQPADRNASASITFELNSGTSLPELASQLEEKGIIRSSMAFTWYVTATGLRKGLQAGTYELNPNNTLAEIADILGNGRVSRNVLVVPEGANIFQIEELAQEKGISQKEFKEALEASYPNDFLAGRPKGVTSLEGYLFPDSYDVNKPVRPKAVVQSMLDNFAKQLNEHPEIIEGFAAQGLTLHQGVTLASIVEREVPGDEDRKLVAGVFLNRLKAGQPLQSDVTVAYAAKALDKPFDLRLDSTYNTYLYKGIPPAPISNPGLSALRAVAQPQQTDYLYFLADKSGKTHYTKTFEEHQQNVDKYLK